VYDFEAYMDKTQAGGRCVSHHKAFAYGFIIIDRRGDIVHSSTYKGVDAATHFVNTLSTKWDDIVNATPSYPLHMSNEHVRLHNNASTCQLCHQKFTNPKQKHRHHDHTKEHNNYLGAYCARCNVQMRNHYTQMPCIAHNHSYDLGLVL